MPHVPPPVIALAAGVTQHVLAAEGRPGAARALGVGAVAAGSMWLVVGSVREFRRNHTTVDPVTPSRASTLVTSGPNRLTRNPMYVGMAGLLTAHAAFRGGWLTVLPVAAFVVVIDQLQIRPEEAALRERFGPEYDDYCRTVRRWL